MVARRPSSRPAAPSVRAPAHTETMLGALPGLRGDPVQDERIVARLHGGNDDVVCTVRIALVECARGRLGLDPEKLRTPSKTAEGVERHWRRPLGNHGDIGDVRPLQDAIGHQEIGNLRRLVESEDGDDRPLAFALPQRLDRPHLLGVIDGRCCRERHKVFSRREHDWSSHQSQHDCRSDAEEDPLFPHADLRCPFA